jgi:hypothetical protein
VWAFIIERHVEFYVVTNLNKLVNLSLVCSGTVIIAEYRAVVVESVIFHVHLLLG